MLKTIHLYTFFDADFAFDLALHLWREIGNEKLGFIDCAILYLGQFFHSYEEGNVHR